MSTILSINNLSKNYGKILALNQVSFQIPKGTVFGILGPNGSGKTTLLGIVMNVLKATSGNFTWEDEYIAQHDFRKNIGTLLETPNFYHYLSAYKNLVIAAKIKGHGEEDIDKVLKIVNLYERKNSAFSTFSLGMKQRLAIASSLLGNPNILVYDEPTNGLDPAGIAEIRELIKSLSQQGKTIIIASHILDEVEKVCTHVAIIQKGVLKTVSTVNELMGNKLNEDAENIMIEIASSDNEVLKNILQKNKNIIKITNVDTELLLTCASNISGEQINQFCFDNGVVLKKLLVKKKSLETRFLEITGTQSVN